MDFIQHVNIKCTLEQFVDIATDLYGSSSDFETKEMTTAKGKTVIKFTEQKDEPAELLMNYDKKNNEIHITPFSMKSRLFVENMSTELHQVLTDLAIAYKGDYVGRVNNYSIVIVLNGVLKKSELAIIEKDSKTIIRTDGVIVDEDEDPNVPHLKINKTIKEYLSENKELYDGAKGLGYPDNMNYIAKYLLQKKIASDINFDEFLDLFRQCVILGANDASVLKFNQILKL